MPPGAELRLATDDPDYLAWMLEHVTAHPAFAWLARRPADWRERPADWPRHPLRGKGAAPPAAHPAFLRFAPARSEAWTSLAALPATCRYSPYIVTTP